MEHDSISYVQLALAKLSFFLHGTVSNRGFYFLWITLFVQKGLYFLETNLCIDVRQPATNEMYLDSRSRLSNKRQCFESNGRKFVGKGNKMKHRCCLLIPLH